MKVYTYLYKELSKDSLMPNQDKRFYYKFAKAFDMLGDEAFFYDSFQTAGKFIDENDKELKDEKCWQQFFKLPYLDYFLNSKRTKATNDLVFDKALSAIKNPESTDEKQLKVIKTAKTMINEVEAKKIGKNNIIIFQTNDYKSKWGEETCPSCKNISGFVIRKICKNCGEEHQTE